RVDLARGPGRLTQALAVGRADDGADLCAPGLLWLARPQERGEIGESVRIGITREVDAVLRFFERGNRYVSGPKQLGA
ncbi:MAG TPA: DNA-3-methyladenine glycosylase, partial [Candidatus Baltobacteraceae bacterium]